MPVGHTKLTAPVLRFWQLWLPLFSTSTRKIYGEPYGTLIAPVLSVGTLVLLKVTKLTTVRLACGFTVTGIGAESLAANVPSPP